MDYRIVYVLPIQEKKKEEPKKEDSGLIAWVLVTLMLAAFCVALTYEKMSEAPKHPNPPGNPPTKLVAE